MPRWGTSKDVNAPVGATHASPDKRLFTEQLVRIYEFES